MSNLKYTSVDLKSTRTDPAFLMILMEKLEPFLDYQWVETNTRFTIAAKQQSKCYFIRSGAISMYRQPDDILIELFDAPTFRGAVSIPEHTPSVYVFKVITPSEIAIIDRDKLFQLFTEHQLWEVFSRHQLAVSSMAIEKMFKLITPTAYNVVRHQLYELFNSSLSVRESIQAEVYIRSKTRLSRSRVMRILSDLKEGGYIEIERGILKKVNQLPEEY